MNNEVTKAGLRSYLTEGRYYLGLTPGASFIGKQVRTLIDILDPVHKEDHAAYSAKSRLLDDAKRFLNAQREPLSIEEYSPIKFLADVVNDLENNGILSQALDEAAKIKTAPISVSRNIVGEKTAKAADEAKGRSASSGLFA